MSPTEDAEGAETEGREDEELSAQATASTTDVTADDEDDEEGENPVELAIRAALEVERARIQAEEEQRSRDRALREENERRAEADRKELQDSWAEATKAARAATRSIPAKDADGNELNLSLSDDYFQEAVVAHFEKHNAKATKAAQTALLGTLAEAAMKALPESQRDEFARRAANRPIDEWLDVYAEMRAPHTRAAKDAEREIAAKIAAAEARGYTKGQRAPGGTPKNGADRPRPTSQPDLSTHSGLASALVKGLISEADYVAKRRALEA